MIHHKEKATKGESRRKNRLKSRNEEANGRKIGEMGRTRARPPTGVNEGDQNAIRIWHNNNPEEKDG